MRGIGPRFKAYESFALPLNYTDNLSNTRNIAEKLLKQNRFQCGFVLLVAGPGFAPEPLGYEPNEILLLHPANVP